MPKIDMCEGDGCKLKDQCYRAKAVPNDPWQAMSFFPGTQGKACIYFIEVSTNQQESCS